MIAEVQARDFTYTNIGGAITITGYTGPGGNVTIPGTIDGLPVTRIGRFTFVGSTNLASVTIPDSVTEIEDGWAPQGGALSFCQSLTNVTMGSGITNIGDFTFVFSARLSTVTIGQSVVRIGVEAFRGCESLSSVTLPNSTVTIEEGGFSGCTSLTNASLGNGLTNIGNSAFWFCTGLTNISIPKSVTEIGNYAFDYCTNLAGAYFEGNAPRLGGYYVFGDSNPTVYYLPGTEGWGTIFGGRPAVLWNPQAQTKDGSFGVRQNRFGFNISGTPDIPLVVEASTNAAGAPWVSLQSCSLTNGLIYFSDPQWTNYPSRFYRIRSP